MKSYIVYGITGLLLLAAVLVGTAGRPGPTSELVPEKTVYAQVPDHLRGEMPEVVVTAESPQMLLDEVIVKASARAPDTNQARIVLGMGSETVAPGLTAN